MQVVALKISFALLLSFLLTLYILPIFSLIAKKLHIIDVPDGKIKLHEKPIPYLGGIGVYVGFIATLALVLPLENKIFFLLVGSTLLLFIGFVDDLLRIPFYQKFFWQSVATFCFVRSGLYLKESFFLNNLWNIPLSFFWILSIINAFNLIDVMDGLAAIVASCATTSFLVIALALGHTHLALLLSCFLGAVLAFFWYNKPPATIYLGDAGSLFIGGFLATIPFLFQWGTYNNYGLLVPFIVLLVPILEITALVVIRTYKGIPFFYASPDHFSIYLQQQGWRKQQILLFILTVSVFLFIISLFFVLNKLTLIQTVGGVFLFLVTWFFVVWYNKRYA